MINTTEPSKDILYYPKDMFSIMKDLCEGCWFAILDETKDSFCAGGFVFKFEDLEQ